jgi:peptidoglycan hydrolase-like protein with peptidoglycan-binding domain
MTTPATIAEGATGPTVRWAQYLLVRRTLSFNQIDGNFGPVTRAAVEQFQHDAELAVDGIAGLQTWAIPVQTAGEVVADLCGVPAPGEG